MHGHEHRSGAGEGSTCPRVASTEALWPVSAADRRGAERDRQVRPQHRELLLEPAVAGVDLADARLLVDAPLAARLEFEVLDRIGDIGALAVDAGIGQRPVEHRAGRPDEGLAREILLVARLLADEDEVGGRQALAEHRLGREAVERAARAGPRPRARSASSAVGAGGRAARSRAASARAMIGGAFRDAVCGVWTMAASLAPAERISGAMSGASGRFFQYLTGISRFIASTFNRAGLKMLA